jgi:nitroreductase
MDIFEAIAKRYSHKVAFDPNIPVPDSDLQKITEAALRAPSAGNAQTPEFIIISDQALLRRIGDLSGNVPLATAPAMIAILSYADMRTTPDRIRGECLTADFAVAAQNMLLAATALGYCCGWVDGPFLKPEISRPVCELLGIPQDRILVMIVPVGHPGVEGPRRPKKPFEQRASWNRYAIHR